jgi:hypothetical protein
LAKRITRPKRSKAANPVGNTSDGVKLQQKESDEMLFSQLHSQVEDARNNRGEWNNRRDFFHRMRMRIRKDKSFPFEGCSNLRMPTVEKFIRKIKASLFTLVWGQRPKFVVEPGKNGNADAAFSIEYYLDYVFEKVLKFSRPLIILLDKMLEKGFVFTEVLWKMEDEAQTVEIDLTTMPEDLVNLVLSAEASDQIVPMIAEIFEIDMSESVREENTEAIEEAIQALQSGEKTARVTFRDETYNNVDVQIHDPEFVYVPVDSKLDPKDARFIAIECYEPWDIVKKKARRGFYSKEVVDSIDYLKDDKRAPSQGSGAMQDMHHTTVTTDDLREGIDRINNPSKSVKLYRMYAWHDLDGDGEEERCVFVIAPEWKAVLAKFPYPHHIKRWPITRFDAELIDDRFFSTRGIPELTDDISREIDTQHNQKVDQQTIRNVPMFAFRSGVVNPKLVKFIPGQSIPVPGTVGLDDAIKVLRNESSAAEFSYRDEEMLLKSELQELVGQVDFSLQSQINRREPRTATEASAQQQAAQTVFGLDVAMFSDSMSDLGELVLAFQQQYAPEEIFFQITGEQQSIRMKRDQIQGGYSVCVRGNSFTTNPAARLQYEQMKISFLTQNPVFLQAGILNQQNLYFWAKKYLQAAGEYQWSQGITSPQPPAPQGPPPPITMIQPKFADLSPGEQAQVLASGGIQFDAEGRALAKEEEMVGGMNESE